MLCFLQKGTQILEKLAASARASKVRRDPPSSYNYQDIFSTGYSTARIDRIVLAVTRGGSFFGSTVETKTSIPMHYNVVFNKGLCHLMYRHKHLVIAYYITD